jgi:hypothetical protein
MKTFLQILGTGVALAFLFVFSLVVASWAFVLFDELARAMVLWTTEVLIQLFGG